MANDSPARNSLGGGRQRSDRDSTPLGRQISPSRVKSHIPANLFQEEPDMYETIKLNPQKTFMPTVTTAPKVRINRVKEKNKRQ